jgi:hypothetical protein
MNQMSKKEFLLPEKPFIPKIKTLIEHSRQQAAVAVNTTLSAQLTNLLRIFR